MGSKYLVEGITLDIYCKEHNLNFCTQSNRVRDYIKRHPELREEEAIKLALSKCGVHFSATKFWYGDVSLADYCRKNGKNYDCLISRIESIKASTPDIDDREATRIAIENYSDREIQYHYDKGIKYYYDGMPLVDYCRLHPEYIYSSVALYIRKKKKKIRTSLSKRLSIHILKLSAQNIHFTL